MSDEEKSPLELIKMLTRSLDEEMHKNTAQQIVIQNLLLFLARREVNPAVFIDTMLELSRDSTTHAPTGSADTARAMAGRQRIRELVDGTLKSVRDAL